MKRRQTLTDLAFEKLIDLFNKGERLTKKDMIEDGYNVRFTKSTKSLVHSLIIRLKYYYWFKHGEWFGCLNSLREYGLPKEQDARYVAIEYFKRTKGNGNGMWRFMQYCKNNNIQLPSGKRTSIDTYLPDPDGEIKDAK
ncbi:MAG: hypothetical protein AABY22_21160 [Nanoarchaeota archaeon]